MDLSCCIAPYGKIIFVKKLLIRNSFRRVKRNPLELIDYTFNKGLRSLFSKHPFFKRHQNIN